MKFRQILGAMAVSAMALGATLAQAQTLTVGTDIENKPFDFVENGKNVGFDQDLWVEIAKELDLDYTMNPMDFSALIPGLQSASLDVAISSIFMTEQRKQVVDFSTPYYHSGNGALVQADSDIQDAAGLDGKRIAALTGSSGAAWVKENLPNAEVSLFPAITGAFLELQTGRVDAIVFDFPSLAYYNRTEGDDNVRLLPERVSEQIDVGIAFPKGSELVPKVNEALEKIRADGRYDTIYEKWFGDLPQ